MENINIENLCMNCFKELTNGCVCEECGYDNDTAVDIIYLQPKTVINDRYIIGSLVSHESDAATYMAYDTQFDEVVTVREFLPKNIANRLEGNHDVHVRERYRQSFEALKASFVKLWSTIANLKNLSALIPVKDVFELNGTAYAVSSYIDSITMHEFLLRNPAGVIDWDKARIMFMPVLTTLEALHSNGIVHGGICPGNLILCRDGKVRLKGFCIAEANTMSSELEFNVNDGYTALEQYENNHKMGPSTDIYAFSACIFRALVGQNPPNAKSREANDKLMIPNTIAEKIPTHVIRALGGGLQIYPEKRTSNINSFREQLNAAPAVVAKSVLNEQPVQRKAEPQPVEEEYVNDYEKLMTPEKKNNSKLIIIVLVVLIIAACSAGVYVAKNGGFISNNNNTTVEQVSKASYTVPNFSSVGYTQSDIENIAAWNKQFNLKFVPEYSVDVEEGIVFEQSVQAGETVEEGTEIILKVSKGVQTAEVPNVGGLTLEEATKILTDAGFQVSTVEVYNDEGNTPGTVRLNNPSAPKEGSICAVGEEVILQVYGDEVTTTQPSTQAEE